MLAILGESIYVYGMDFTPLQQSLSRHPEIIAAYVFGSAVTGKLTPMSDIDVAILLREEIPFARELDISSEVMSTIEKNFRREGDVRFINRVRDLPFLHEVLAAGKLIYEADREMHRAYVARTVIAYLDYLPFFQKAMHNYTESLKRGQAQRSAQKDFVHS